VFSIDDKHRCLLTGRLVRRLVQLRASHSIVETVAAAVAVVVVVVAIVELRNQLPLATDSATVDHYRNRLNISQHVSKLNSLRIATTSIQPTLDSNKARLCRNQLILDTQLDQLQSM
jgi:hypothetical protein